MGKKIPIIGVAACVVYFIAVAFFIITKTEIALTIWEALTIMGAPIILFVLMELANLMNIASIYRNAMLVFMSCVCSLTGLAHFINITVTRRLIADGVTVPNFFRIGYWPSVEMAADYLAWGFFLGLSYLSVGLAIQSNEKNKLTMKRTVIVCGILCFAGFLGALFINESLWYFAPIGYGIGTIVICVQMMRTSKQAQ